MPGMADTVFQPVITAAGVAAALAADGLGLDLNITHIALGSGKYAPTSGQTALVDRREKAACGPGSTASSTAFQVLATFSGYSGADYDLGEIGFYAGDPDAGGVLFAVASRVGERFAVRSASVATYTADYTVNLSGVPAGSVTITVDPGAGVAAGLLAAHTAASNPHPQYVQGEVPVGAEMLFMRRVAPRGWLTKCGALVSRTIYADLWALAQAEGLVAASEIAWLGAWTLFGPGDGATTFRLPDTRGEFGRDADLSRGVDPGRAVGSHQFGSVESHTHSLPDTIVIEDGGSGGPGGTTSGNASVVGPTGATGGAETRPRNAARIGCIKAGPASLPAGPEPSLCNFTANVTSGAGTLNVTFTDSTTGAPATSWAWTFGDGGTATVQNPTHLYSAPGTYTVTLVVKNAADITSRLVRTAYITVT